MALEPISWMTAEPVVLERERRLMAGVAPELKWMDDSPSGGWRGRLPRWPFERPEPPGLEAFLGGRSFLVLVTYPESFPMAEPRIYPLDPEPDLAYRSLHDWHLNGEGSLCLLRRASDWDGTGSASEVVVKAAAWFLEYLLLEGGIRTAMTESGIAADAGLDRLLSGEASVKSSR